MPCPPGDTAGPPRVFIRPGALAELPALWAELFPNRPPLIVADGRTWAAAGRRVQELLAGSAPPFLLPGDHPRATWDQAQELARRLAAGPEVPVGVGSGTVTDTAKLAAGEARRPWLAVATAASMDGYTAAGAALLRDGFKRTFPCPGPAALVADLEVLAAAPPELAAAGFGDLAAKFTAGADWILAEALGIEERPGQAWDLVQGGLARRLSRPEGIRRGEGEPLQELMEGLVRTGFAMSAAGSSRPASGADHQFSHLWDLEDHRHRGRPVLHGFQVGLGTLAAAALYDRLLALPDLDASGRPEPAPPGEEVARAFPPGRYGVEAVRLALAEAAAKSLAGPAFAARRRRLAAAWPELRRRLRDHLPAAPALRELLARAGAPVTPEEIGLTRLRLRESHLRARLIRRRYTVLDLAAEAGRWEECLEELFGAGGFWGPGP